MLLFYNHILSLLCTSPCSSYPSLLATTNLSSIKNFFSLQKYYIHRVRQYKTFWGLLFSLSVIPWRIQVVCVSTACFFLLLNYIQWYRYTTCLRTSVQIPVFGYYKWSCFEHLCTEFYVNISFHFSR